MPSKPSAAPSTISSSNCRAAPEAEDSKVGDLWFDTSDESLTLFVYTNLSGFYLPDPPVSLDGMATIEAALIVQTDLLARVESTVKSSKPTCYTCRVR